MTASELDELMYRWPTVLRHVMAGTDEWLKGFARSVAKHGKRAAWRPTAKQAQIMRRLVSELDTAPEQDIELIER
ncbi:hypothetical protein ACN2XU_14490 [Primorskyibacter sp. 2E107]|uniref:hypothetical protein n=1 Tax=Primorskyibacter sp. 2E107 TaxID=3403458 RepID=UPI003AF8C5DE